LPPRRRFHQELPLKIAASAQAIKAQDFPTIPAFPLTNGRRHFPGAMTVAEEVLAVSAEQAAPVESAALVEPVA
jgi:hypothetical protein